ncbi:hypothetical protein [Vibrio vulnificus]|uniref:hypothetical protein n=1 Tax=Vibrio vulnificus TaxID=672 RepID=UPI0010288363|nr:hypothetical protein [Vibrio vulnificus]RZP88972.1 hypothetical protein D8T54_20305 [Vibrio vulnificus]
MKKTIVLQSGVRVDFKSTDTEANFVSFTKEPIVSVAFVGDKASRLVITSDSHATLFFIGFRIEMTRQEAIDVVEIMTNELGFTFTTNDMRETQEKKEKKWKLW